MSKPSFQFWDSYFSAVEECPREYQDAFWGAIIRYIHKGENPDFSWMKNEGQMLVKSLWKAVFPIVHISKTKKGNVNASKEDATNLPPACHEDATNLPPACHPVEVEVEEEDIKEESIKKKRTAFVPPTLSEVSDYISEKGYKIDAEAFVSYYSSIGWMVGRNKMKDWRMALVTWMKRDNTSRDTRHNTQPQRSMKPIKAEDIL